MELAVSNSITFCGLRREGFFFFFEAKSEPSCVSRQDFAHKSLFCRMIVFSALASSRNAVSFSQHPQSFFPARSSFSPHTVTLSFLRAEQYNRPARSASKAGCSRSSSRPATHPSIRPPSWRSWRSWPGRRRRGRRPRRPAGQPKKKKNLVARTSRFQ